MLIFGDAAGFAYCGVGALSLLGKLPSTGRFTEVVSKSNDAVDEEFVQEMLHWLVFRQTALMQEPEDQSECLISNELISPPASNGVPPSVCFHVQDAPFALSSGSKMKPLSPSPESVPNFPPIGSLQISQEDLLFQGLNGRCNKVADTCYSFWAGGTLDVS